ncbi:Protein kinase domain - like 10, partial [Theobroma cacao]
TWRRISYHELNQATNGFSESRLLGKGNFGSVYQGTLSDGMRFAVKVFKLEFEGAFKSFEIECEVLRNIRHRNLMKIISSCCNIDFKALVLEFMPNGSLDKWLYSNNYFLDILRRLNIMIDVASALEYLHHGHTMPVVHCDSKLSNVLLNEDMVAHLSDFGIAKLLCEEDSMIQTMTIATIGYMEPALDRRVWH